MTNALRPLRWYAGLAVVFFGLLPAVLLTLLVTGGSTPGSVGIPLGFGVLLLVAAIVNAVRGMTDPDPEQAARRLHLCLALVAGADLVMLGGNALIRMAAA